MTVSRYRESFLCETAEHLQSMAECLLILDQGPENEAVLIPALRSAHTLKGMAAAMGYKSVIALAHEMESVLISFQNHSLRVSPAVMALLFKCLDALQIILDGNGRGSSALSRPLIRELRKLGGAAGEGFGSLFSGSPAFAAMISPNAGILLHNAPGQGRQIFRASLALAPDAAMKAARVFMVFKKITDRGAEIIETDPPIQDLQEERFGDRFDVVFCAQEPAEAFADLLSKISEVSLLDLERLEPALIKATPGVAPPALRSTCRVPALAGCAPAGRPARAEVGRMIPAKQLFGGLSLMVRRLSRQLEKKVRLKIRGEMAELDHGVAGEIMEPLVHLLRNAVDHGIESPDERARAGKRNPACLTLAVSTGENEVLFELTDDGRGVDLDLVRSTAVQRGLLAEGVAADEAALLSLIFEPGFSTAALSDISGRGLGLDIVRSKIVSLGGSVDLKTTKGQGASFKIRLPAPAAETTEAGLAKHTISITAQNVHEAV